MNWQVHPFELQFKNPAKTSRDTLVSKIVWYLHLMENNTLVGIGEVAPIFGLSSESKEEVEMELQRLVSDFDNHSTLSSVQCAIETALSGYANGDAYQPFASDSIVHSIDINGLVWMNELDAMRKQAFEKVSQGNKCIKLKIGALNFRDELSLIAELRNQYSSADLTIRVDANGAFSLIEIDEVLNKLAVFEIHSIEQPIRAGQTKELFELAMRSPVPIALDEELIGRTPAELSAFLKFGIPHYLVLKPSIHGGFEASQLWIEWAKQHGIEFWITSALESNVGLNAIARWVCAQNISGVQGLGTGGLFVNNTPPLWQVEADKLMPIGYGKT